MVAIVLQGGKAELTGGAQPENPGPSVRCLHVLLLPSAGVRPIPARLRSKSQPLLAEPELSGWATHFCKLIYLFI